MKEYLLITEELDNLFKHVDERIEKDKQQIKACKKKTELETKLAHELKLNAELTARLAELSKRGCDLERVCATFGTSLTIADSDRNRLDNAKESYQLAKELTNVRLDFSATMTKAKGYVKSEARKLLQPFEIDMTSSGGTDELWSLIQTSAAPSWPADKENHAPPN